MTCAETCESCDREDLQFRYKRDATSVPGFCDRHPANLWTNKRELRYNAARFMFRKFISSFLLTALIAFSQSFTANLTGVITDPAGAAVSGATVRLENAATRDVRETTTTNDGRFTFSQLAPGTYDAQAEATGFKTTIQRNITLIAGQSAALNISLVIGALTQQVDVGATVVEVDTQTANQSITLTQSMIVNLPSNLRSPFSLVHATAGVTAPATGISQSAYDQNQDRFGLNGGRSTTTGVLIDGVNASAGNSWNGLLVSPSLDSVAEVQVIRNAYDAQYARSGGGMVSMVTKGGSGDFHGSRSTSFATLSSMRIHGPTTGPVRRSRFFSVISSAETWADPSGNRSGSSSSAPTRGCARGHRPLRQSHFRPPWSVAETSRRHITRMEPSR